MNTIDRINKLMGFCNLPSIPAKQDLHDAINSLDDSLGVNTEFPTSLECTCLWHIGKTCYARRTVGARLALLEHRMAHILDGGCWVCVCNGGTFKTAPI